MTSGYRNTKHRWEHRKTMCCFFSYFGAFFYKMHTHGNVCNRRQYKNPTTTVVIDTSSLHKCLKVTILIHAYWMQQKFNEKHYVIISCKSEHTNYLHKFRFNFHLCSLFHKILFSVLWKWLYYNSIIGVWLMIPKENSTEYFLGILCNLLIFSMGRNEMHFTNHLFWFYNTIKWNTDKRIVLKEIGIKCVIICDLLIPCWTLYHITKSQ